MTPVEVRIKQTEEPQRGLVIVTARSNVPNLLRPFVLSVRDETRGLHGGGQFHL